MALYEGVPNPTVYGAMLLNNFIQKRRSKRAEVTTSEAATKPARLFNSFIRIVLHIVGFSALTNAMFHWNIIAGWCAVAVSCFIFSWLFTGNESASADSGQTRR